MDPHHDGSSPWDDVPSQGQDQPAVTQATSGGNKSPEQPNTRQQQSAAGGGTAARSAPSSSSSARGRSSRNPKRFAVHSTHLSSADDPLGPLGESTTPTAPLGSPVLSPSARNLPASSQNPVAASSNASLKTLMGSINLEDEHQHQPAVSGRPPPPVQPAAGQDASRPHEPSVNVVQASKPSFHITVGDPHKVGDITSAHTEYMVYTKTTSKAYKNPEFTVSRRFRDFLWLYNTLHNNNPGIIVPPPPEKQAVGRFNAEFVESRRQALERMLNKIAAHPSLQRDADLKLFLESDSFTLDIKHKERKEPLVAESKGVFSSIGLGSAVPKYVEHDDWFHDRRVYLDALENQLKSLEKAVDTVIGQRKALAEACGDFSISLHSLAQVELSPTLSGPLEGLSELQDRVQQLYERQAQQDVLTLGIVIDEYIRMIGSCKTAFSMRERSYNAYSAAEAELGKKKATQDKLLRQGRSQTDRLNQLEAEVADAEKRAHQARLLWDDMGRILRQELDRFEKEKVEEFKSSVETYLESAAEAQKELIEIWETYLMRLDAEDDTEDQQQREASQTVPPEAMNAEAVGEAASTAVDDD